MNDPTNWNPEVDAGSFEFASPEEAKRAEAILCRAMRESYEHGLAAGRNEAEGEAIVLLRRWLERLEYSDPHGDKPKVQAYLSSRSEGRNDKATDVWGQLGVPPSPDDESAK